MYINVIKVNFPKAFSEGNNPKEYDKIPDCDKYVLQEWIKECLEPYKTKNYYHYSPTSYSLKHAFEKGNSGFYITNGVMKGAMLAAGYEPKDYNALNWVFKLGKRAGEKRDLSIPIV